MEYLLPAISGALLALSFPNADISALAWVSLVPLLYHLKGRTPRQAFMSGLVAGLVFNLASIYWIVVTMDDYGGLSFLVSAALLFLLSGYLALYIGAFSWLFSTMDAKRPGWTIVTAPLFWAALELARDHLLSGFPWDLLGYSQHANLGVIQVSDITGVYGVSALIVLINCAVLDIILIAKKKTPSAIGLVRPAAAFLVLAAILGYGHWRLRHMPPTVGNLKVALVQGNIDQFHKWDPAYQADVFDTYKTLTAQAARERPGLIVWPETATPFYFQDPGRRAALEALARKSGTYLMTGSPSFESAGDGRYTDYNSAYLVSPEGGVAGRYDKMHLVPFGEYVPLKRLLPFVSKMVTAIGDFGTGSHYTVLKAGDGTFGTAICFEAIFPELVRHFPLAGANFLVSITNDAWFGRTAAPYQDFDMVVFRAVENRRAIVRAANTGISGIMLPTGEVAGSTRIFTTRYMTGDIPLMTGLTFYARHGDVFAYGCMAASLLFLAAIFLKRGETR